MRRPLFTILYEDQRGPGREHGVHDMLVACVLDRLGPDAVADFRIYQALELRCLKGVDNVLRALREDFLSLTRDGRQVAAVLDSDVIRDKLRLPPLASEADVEAAIRKTCPMPQHLSLCLLLRNTETLIRVAADCAQQHHRPLPPEQVRRACEDKNRLDRDLLLRSLRGPEHAAIRGCIEQRMPNLGKLADHLAQHLRT